jgi:hypothetical protein
LFSLRVSIKNFVRKCDFELLLHEVSAGGSAEIHGCRVTRERACEDAKEGCVTVIVGMPGITRDQD